MADITNAQKKEWARTLYLKENLTQAEISEKVGVSRRTINTWCTSGKWEELKAGITMGREQQILDIQRQISEINKSIGEREPGQRFATESESLRIAKLSTAIDKLEKDAGLKDIISAGIKFFSWLRGIDIAKAKELEPFWDNFINSLL